MKNSYMFSFIHVVKRSFQSLEGKITNIYEYFSIFLKIMQIHHPLNIFMNILCILKYFIN